MMRYEGTVTVTLGPDLGYDTRNIAFVAGNKSFWVPLSVPEPVYAQPSIKEPGIGKTLIDWDGVRHFHTNISGPRHWVSSHLVDGEYWHTWEEVREQL